MIRLYAAGSNARGQLGSGHCEDQHTLQPAVFAHEDEGTGQSPTLPGGASQILELACGANHTLVLLDTHELWVAGDSSRGQLAYTPSTNVFRRLWLVPTGNTLNKKVYKPTSVAASWETSYITFTSDDPELSDAVFSFGADDFGDRGNGPSPEPAEPTLVDFEPAFLSSPWCIKVRELVAGQHHVLARLEVWAAKGSEPHMVVVGWGACRHGQLGALPAAPSKRPTRSSSRSAPQPANKFDQPRIIAIYTGEEKPIQLAAGSQHSLILHSTHRVTPLGSSRHGQLDIPKPLLEPATLPNAVQNIGSTWSTSFFVTHRPKGDKNMIVTFCIDSCGSSNHGQLGRPPDTPFGPIASLIMGGPLDFVQIACGSEHVLLRASDGVWGWGWNEHGNLGLGHTKDVHRPVAVWDSWSRGKAGDGKTILGVWAGCGTSWILVRKDPSQESESTPATPSPSRMTESRTE